MRSPFTLRSLVCITPFVVAAAASLSCGSSEDEPSSEAAGASGGAGAAGGGGAAGGSGSCKPLCFEAGDPDGHPDPAGAKAAKQARAGRIKSESQIRQREDGRQRVRVGDFFMANEKIAAYIEDKGISDGYARFGGEILAIERVADDGLPEGKSLYGETLFTISSEMIDPDSVTVLQDGSDGKEAVVRVMGNLKSVPFLGALTSLFPGSFKVPAIYDFVLAPGSEKLVIRLGLKNTLEDEMDVTYGEIHGFFQSSRSQLVTPEFGYDKPKKSVSYVGFDGGDWSMAWRTPAGKMAFSLGVSGFQYFSGSGFKVAPGAELFRDHVEVIPAAGGLDALNEAVRRVDGAAAWREVKGKVVDAQGQPVAGAHVYELDGGDQLLSRVDTGADGSFVLHAPEGPAKLVARKAGFQPTGALDLAAGQVDAQLAFAPTARLHVMAKEAEGGALPVRIQVIPKQLPPGAPAAWGEADEADGRLFQEFSMTGDATFDVPPGEVRVLVSRGYEWELFDETLTLEAGAKVDVNAALVHSVDTTGVMCADFHIHSFYSADSSDPVVHKVKGAVADGLDVPVSSEHEWVIDFQPVIEQLGVQKWAFGMPSEELTTFTWGHFGVIPLRPRPELVNNGAMDWVGKKPPQVLAEVHALADKPLVIVNHPSGKDFGAYFGSTGFERSTGKGKQPGMWSDEFEAVEVFNDSNFDSNRDKSVGDWFALLDTGRKVWAVGSSDSHGLRTSPVGYPRTCIAFGHDDPQKLTPEAVRDGVASGAATVSGGLYMTVKGPGGEGPGATLSTGGGPVTFTVEVAAATWVDATTLEVIVNGKTVSEEPLSMVGGGPGKRFSNTVTVSAEAGRPTNWVVFHARGGDLAPLHPGRKAFAASNPVFLQ